MNSFVKIAFFVILVFCAIVSAYLTMLAFNFSNSLVPPTLLPEEIIYIFVAFFACSLALFTYALYMLVLLFGIIELRDRLQSYKLKRTQLQQLSPSVPSRNPTTVQLQTEIRRRRQAQLRKHPDHRSDFSGH